MLQCICCISFGKRPTGFLFKQKTEKLSVSDFVSHLCDGRYRDSQSVVRETVAPREVWPSEMRGYFGPCIVGQFRVFSVQ